MIGECVLCRGQFQTTEDRHIICPECETIEPLRSKIEEPAARKRWWDYYAYCQKMSLGAPKHNGTY